MRSIVILLVLVTHLLATDSQAQSPDLVLLNGKIFTADSSRPYVQALAIKGNKIVYAGTTDEAKKLSRKAKTIDLAGRTVVPGFNDAHDHPGWFAPIGKSYGYNEFNPAGPSKEVVLDSVTRLVKIARPGEWIQGLIGTTIFFDSTMRTLLDSIAPNNPVSLQIWWGHGMVVNAKALELSGISDTDGDPLAGWYIRTPVTKKISSVQQNAQAPFWISVKHSEPHNFIKGLKMFSDQQLAAGITTVQYMGTGLTAEKALDDFGKADLDQRVRIIAWPRSTTKGRQLSEWKAKTTRPSPLSYISGVKYVIDGTPLEGNALRREPYDANNMKYGRLNYPVDTIRQILNEALKTNTQLMLHITADSSFATVLNLIRETGTASQWKPKRLRIEHNCVGPISADQRKVLKDFGIIMMHTPKYCMGSPLRSLIEDGVMVGIAPDGTDNPFVELMMVLTMQSDPKENLTLEQALTAYTKNNAFAEFEEKRKGTLTKGKLADLAVLSQDIFTIPGQQLPGTKSVLTIVDGKIVYNSLTK